MTGVDLTQEFVLVSRSLTRRTKLDHAVEFLHGSALALPFDPATFDRAYTIHASMNIADKPGLFREVRIRRMRRGQWNPAAAPATAEGN